MTTDQSSPSLVCPPATSFDDAVGRGPRPAGSVLAAVGVGSFVLFAALVLAGGRPQPSVAGLADAGPLTGWALPAVRLVFDLAAVTTVGALLTGGVLLRPVGSLLSAVALSAVRSAAWSAGLWSVSAALLFLLTASETAGLPLGGLTARDLGDHAAAGPGRAPLVVAVVGAVVAFGCSRTRTQTGARRLLMAAGLGLLPTTLTGHAASAADHELAVSSLVVHVVAATVWVGGLLAILLFVRRPSDLAFAVRRFSGLAAACFTLVALSGLLSAFERLGSSAAAWSSGYGALVLTKAALLMVLGAMGWQHRRRLVPALALGRPGAFWSFAGAEVAAMGGAFALAVALSRTPTPTSSEGVAPVAAHGAGHGTLPDTVDPVSLTGLLLEWRVNAVVLAVVGLTAVAYLAGVRRVRADLAGVRRVRADFAPWPRRRSAAFAAGLLTALLALSSGVATYAAAMLSVQVAQFVLLLVVAPVLLVLGEPLTLLQRVRASEVAVAGQDLVPAAPSPVVRALLDPLAVMVLVAGLVFAVYRTGLLDRALGSAGLFLLVNISALAIGWLLVWSALGGGPARSRSAADRVAPLLAAAASMVLLAAELRYSDQILAGRWFAELGWSWVDPAADQRLAALVAATGALLLLALAAAAWRSACPVPPTPGDLEPRHDEPRHDEPRHDEPRLAESQR